MPLIHEAIPLVMADLGAIGKGRENTFHRYKFRGIDDVYNACHAVFCKHKVFTVPVVHEQIWSEYVDEKGRRTLHVAAKIAYYFYASDGSFVTATVLGEGADSGDKAANKAMAAAHKYALLQVLAIPTEEPKDSENESPELSGERVAPKPAERHPIVEAAERTFGIEEMINDEQYNDILAHFERLNWPKPHAINFLRKHYDARGPKELTNKKAAACLLDLEARQPEPAKGAK